MISATSKYALKALAYLGALPKGSTVVSGRLAEFTGVPANYLYKILLDLKRAGFVEATRGIGGGYRLSRKPENIRIFDIVSLFEGPNIESRCLLEGMRICSDKNPCSAHEAWREVGRVYADFLKKTSIASISKNALLPSKRDSRTIPKTKKKAKIIL